MPPQLYIMPPLLQKSGDAPAEYSWGPMYYGRNGEGARANVTTDFARIPKIFKVYK